MLHRFYVTRTHVAESGASSCAGTCVCRAHIQHAQRAGAPGLDRRAEAAGIGNVKEGAPLLLQEQGALGAARTITVSDASSAASGTATEWWNEGGE